MAGVLRMPCEGPDTQGGDGYVLEEAETGAAATGQGHQALAAKTRSWRRQEGRLP